MPLYIVQKLIQLIKEKVNMLVVTKLIEYMGVV